MSKTWLVARREYLENLRTKTFWIGILAFPLIFVAAFFIGRLLEKGRDVRSYAIIDHTPGQWISKEIEARRARSDLERILGQHTARQPEAEQPRTPAELRERLRKAREDLGDGGVGVVFDLFLELDDAELAAILEASQDQGRLSAVLQRLVPRFVQLASRRDPQELARLFGGAGSRLIDITDLGGDLAQVEAVLRERVSRGELFAYFVIGPNPVASEAGSRYVSNNVTDTALRDQIAGVVTEIVRERRVAQLDITPEQAASLRDQFEFAARKVSRAGEEEEVTRTDTATNWAPMAFVYLLWIAVFSVAQMLLTNTIEEKSNRIIEVLLSSVSPHQLMIGKIWGLAATGLTVIGSWVVVALIGLEWLGGTIGNVDVLGIASNPLFLASFIGYFLAGYLLFAAVLVAIGSVCNSLKEAQNLMQPVILLLVVPLIAMPFVVKDPNGTMSRVLTYIPLYTPFLMMNRAGGPPPLWEYAATSALIVLTLVLAFWAAGKVFRVGVLMTGKPPRLREILAWLRPSEGVSRRRPSATPAGQA